jgi:hypothetical protein
MPNESPLTHCSNVNPPMLKTAAPHMAATRWRPVAHDSKPRPLRITHNVALGWIEMPLLSQSVSRGMFNTQPASETTPPSSA